MADKKRRKTSGLIVPGEEQETLPDLRGQEASGVDSEPEAPGTAGSPVEPRPLDAFLALGYQPLGDVIMVLPRIEHETVRASGIVIPQAILEKQRVTEGDVIAVGPGRYAEFSGNVVPMTVQRGDRVIFSHFAGSEMEETIEIGGVEKVMKIRVMRQHDVLFKRVPKDSEGE